MFRVNDKTPRATKAISGATRIYLKEHGPRGMSDDAVEVSDHPFLDVLARPNPILDASGLFWLTVAYLQLNGSAYWHLQLNNLGTIKEIWPLPAQYVAPILGPNRLFDEYELRLGSERLKFPADEIVHFRKPSPIDTLGPLGNLRGVIEAAETNIRMMEYQRALMENFAVPDVLISAKGETTAPQMEKIKEDWRSTYGGWRNAGVPGVIPIDVTVQKLGFTMRELQYDKGRDSIRDEILAGFGVPLPIIRSDGTTFSNMGVGVNLWMRNTIKPLMKIITDKLNARVMPLYAPTTAAPRPIDLPAPKTPWFVAYDDPTPEDKDARMTRVTSAVASGVMTINEARAQLGQDAVDWGKEPWLPAGLQQPSQMEASAEFETGLRQTAADAALAIPPLPDTTPAPPTFGELAGLLSALISTSDIDAANLVRAAIAERLGATLAPVDEIKPSGSSGIVDPTEEDMNHDEPKGGSEEGKDNPKTKPPGEGGDAATDPKEKPSGKDKPKKSVGDDDGQAGFDREQVVQALAATRIAAYEKAVEDIHKPGDHDKGFLAQLKALFASLRADVEKHIGDAVGRSRLMTSPIPRETLEKLLINRKEWIERFSAQATTALTPLYLRGAQLGGAELSQLGMVAVAGLTRDEMLAAATKFAAKMAVSVIDTQIARYADVVKPLLDAGENVQTITTEVAKVFEKNSTDAETIARTEAINILNDGAMSTYRKAGITEHEWLRSVDACEFCQVMDGQKVVVGKAFLKVGDIVKGADGGRMRIRYRDILHPGLHPRCVCTTIPIVGL